jgi:hypothetical protein
MKANSLMDNHSGKKRKWRLGLGFGCQSHRCIRMI